MRDAEGKVTDEGGVSTADVLRGALQAFPAGMSLALCSDSGKALQVGDRRRASAINI